MHLLFLCLKENLVFKRHWMYSVFWQNLHKFHLTLSQLVWDVFEMSQSDLYCDAFNTSQIHLKKDLFFVTPLRRLKHFSTKMFIL